MPPAPAHAAFALLIALWVATGPGSARAQDAGRVAGRVVDVETTEPLPGARVFLAHTQMNTATGPDGRFAIAGVVPGSYQVAVSMIGYEPGLMTVDVRGGEPREVDFLLRPKVYEMAGPIVMGERSRTWRRDLEQFQKLFLGRTENAEKTKIVNPGVLDFTRTREGLLATASEPLVIENRALGYRLTYVLSQFDWIERGDHLTLEGAPLFEEMTPADSAEAARWRENRTTAFQGSFQHLLWALAHDRVTAEGFVLEEARSPNYPPAPKRLTASDLAEPTDDPHAFTISFGNFLQVTYSGDDNGEKRSFWRSLTGRGGGVRRLSWLRMTADSGVFHALGYLDPPSPLTITGYMARERVADLLPREYVASWKNAHPNTNQ